MTRNIDLPGKEKCSHEWRKWFENDFQTFFYCVYCLKTVYKDGGSATKYYEE